MTTIQCFFDGACWPKNPGGIMGWGYTVADNGTIIHTGYNGANASELNSNNVAEYKALIDCLNWLIENNLSNRRIEIFGDSQLVVFQMTGKWKIKAGRYKNDAIECLNLLQQFSDINISWVPRSQNELADELSNQGVGIFITA